MPDTSNLHPVWAKYVGTDQKAKPAPTPTTLAEILARPMAAPVVPRATSPAKQAGLSQAQIQMIANDDGWIPASAERPAYGAPVTVKKQLDRHTWITTLVLPGDARYPYRDHAASSNAAHA